MPENLEQRITSWGTQVDEASACHPGQSFEQQAIDDATQLLFASGLGCSNKRLRTLFSKPRFYSTVAVGERLHFTPEYINEAVNAIRDPEVFPDRHSFGLCTGAVSVKHRGNDLPIDRRYFEDHLRLIMETTAEHGPQLIVDPITYTEGNKRARDEATQIGIMRNYLPEAHLMVRAVTEPGMAACVDEYARTGNVSTIHTIIQSPLNIVDNGDSTTVDGLSLAIENNVPFCLTSHPIMGWTGPASLYGIVVQATAEYLGGLCTAYGIQQDNGTDQDGLVAVNGAFPAVRDPYKLTIAYGAPATNIANLLTARVAKAIGGRSCQGGCLISGEHTPVNGQTDCETAEGHEYFTANNGFDTLRGGGLTNQLLCVDVDKVRADLRSAQRYAEDPRAHARLYSSVPEEYIEQDILGYMIDLIRDRGSFEVQNHTQANIDRLLAMQHQNF